MDKGEQVKECNLGTGIELCREIEAICPLYGCHVALTGGILYKDGIRKDIDILFYKVRQIEKIDMDGLWKGLLGIGLEKTKGFGWCYKGEYKGCSVDMFFPDDDGGDYEKLSQDDMPLKVC